MTLSERVVEVVKRQFGNSKQIEELTKKEALLRIELNQANTDIECLNENHRKVLEEVLKLLNQAEAENEERKFENNLLKVEIETLKGEVEAHRQLMRAFKRENLTQKQAIEKHEQEIGNAKKTKQVETKQKLVKTLKKCPQTWSFYYGKIKIFLNLSSMLKCTSSLADCLSNGMQTS